MTLISLVKKSKYLTNRSLHHTTQCLKVPKSSYAQPAKAPMQCVLDTTGAVSMHELPPKVCNQLPTAKNQENLRSTQPFEIWPYSISSRTSHGISGSPPEELKCCLLLWFAHRAIPELHQAPPATLTGCTSTALWDNCIGGGNSSRHQAVQF